MTSPTLLVKMRFLLRGLTREDQVVLPMFGRALGTRDRDMPFAATAVRDMIEGRWAYTNLRFIIDEEETLRRIENDSLEIRRSKTPELDAMINRMTGR